ncbi:MAG: hypothetical protein AAF531_02755 [Actinomycetota bacterium]
MGMNGEGGSDRNDAADRAMERDITVEAERPGDRGTRRKRGRGTPEGTPCDACGAPLSAIRINVDGRTLLMESCDGCDTRRWQLAGEEIDLQEALNQVGEHAGRRRMDA